MELAQACQDLGLRPIHGAELYDRERRRSSTSRSWSRSAAGWHNLCRLLTEAHAETRPQPDRIPSPRARARLAAGAQRGARLPLRLRPRGGAGRRLGTRRAARARRLARRLLGAFGRERLRVELQRPLWRRDRARNRWLRRRRAAGRRLRGDRQRPRPRPQPGRAPGRAGRRAHAHDARGVRAAAARQRELGAGDAGGDGGALRRAPGGDRRDRAAGRAAALRPHLGARLPLSRAPRIPRPTAPWRRSAAGGSSSATPASPSGPRPSGGWRRSCG